MLGLILTKFSIRIILASNSFGLIRIDNSVSEQSENFQPELFGLDLFGLIHIENSVWINLKIFNPIHSDFGFIWIDSDIKFGLNPSKNFQSEWIGLNSRPKWFGFKIGLGSIREFPIRTIPILSLFALICIANLVWINLRIFNPNESG